MTWVPTSLGEVCRSGGGGVQTGPFGSQLHASDYSAEGTPVVMPQDIGDNRIDTTNVARVDNDHVERLSRHMLALGDIVYSRRGDVERRALIREENVGWLCGTGCLRVHFGPRPAADPTFVSYYLGLPQTREWIVRHAVGATMLNLNTSILSALPMTLPSLNEQRAIAGVLGALDDRIAMNDKSAGTAIALSNALYAVQGESFNERRSLGDLVASGVLALSDGYRTKRSEHGRPGLRILRAGDIREGQMFPEGEDFVGESYLRQIGGKASEAGDILLTTKGTVGRVAVVPRGAEQVVYSPQICYFRVRDPAVLDGAVLAAWFRSDDFKRQASTVMFKSDMAPYISLTDIRAMSVPIPSAEVLNAICGAHAALLDRFSQANRENLVLKALRDAMLPPLMSGKISVGEAERVLEGVL